jgi:hypothetical protein
MKAEPLHLLPNVERVATEGLVLGISELKGELDCFPNSLVLGCVALRTVQC